MSAAAVAEVEAAPSGPVAEVEAAPSGPVAAVLCVGGPYDGHGFYPEEWAERVRAAARIWRHGGLRAPALDYWPGTAADLPSPMPTLPANRGPYAYTSQVYCPPPLHVQIEQAPTVEALASLWRWRAPEFTQAHVDLAAWRHGQLEAQGATS